jgi:hypothetical protein
MRLGTETVGRWGLVILVVTGVLGGILAVHGWSTRSTALPRVTLGNTRSARAAPSTPTRQQGPTPAESPSAQSPSADHNRPLLSAQPYANVTYQVWPGNPSSAGETALIGLSVSVKQLGSALLVTAGVNGQTPTQRRYVGGVRVYVVEASLGDDSGNTDYNLGDDALVVTDAKGGIIQ